MKYHILAFVLGFILDLILGDPYCLPHPIRLIGTCIAKLDKSLRIQGNTGEVPQSDITLTEPIVEGSAQSDDTQPAHMEGSAQSDDTQPAHMEGYTQSDDTQPAHMEGYTQSDDTQPAHVEGYTQSDDTQSAHMEGFAQSDDTQPAHMEGSAQSDDTQPALATGEINHKNFLRGIVLVITILPLTILVSAGILFIGYSIHPVFGVIFETVMTYQILATKCLKVESMKVYKSLKTEGLEASQKAVSMIVGRDTAVLDEAGVCRAAIETVAENTSDGVIAPMIYTAIGGPVLGFFYKAINTMDSMVGYKNDKYLYFGRAAAKLDDAANYLPARISAGLMILAAFLGGREFSGKEAVRIYKRDNRNHASPNSAQTEAVCAGALQIRLAGDTSYFGKIVKKPFIGDNTRLVEYEDIRRANKLLYLTAFLGETICLAVMIIIMICLH